MTAAIETTRLAKRYGDVTAVEDLSLRVAAGEIYAFLGLNGAGKTTTIRMLLGMVRATAGEARVLGTRIGRGRENPWARVGYLVETPHAYPELTVRENLEAVRHLRPGTPAHAVESILDRLALGPWAGRRARTLSLGNAQRLGLAKALLHEPELLILDEPANGLDPAGIVEIRDLLTSLARDRGVSVFLSSHILGEVARIAHRIGIIHEGRLLEELDVSGLEQLRRRRLIVRARDLVAARTALERAGYACESTEDGAIEVIDRRAVESPEAIASCLVQAGAPPTMLAVQQEDLEEYFLRLVGGRERE